MTVSVSSAVRRGLAPAGASPLAVAPAVSLLASIPSPSSGTLDSGRSRPHVRPHAARCDRGARTSGRRWVNRGGDWDLIFRCAVWGVAAGIVGARIYHVVTSWDEVPDEWWGVFAIWRGGLGVWGGIALGCLVGGIVAKRAGADVWLLADCLAPGLLIAQVNRRRMVEPGALRQADRPAVGARDRRNRRSRTPPGTTFHPTFLYELIWDLANARGRARLRDRAALPSAAAGDLRGVHRALLRGALLRGAPADVLDPWARASKRLRAD